MSRSVKIGDRFKLLGKEWGIKKIEMNAMWAEVNDTDLSDLRWPLSEADALDWIEPEVRFTKEQVEAIKNIYMAERVAELDGGPALPLEAWLNEHTES